MRDLSHIYAVRPHWWLEKRFWVMYLYPPDDILRRYRDLIDIPIDREFTEIVGSHVEALLQKGVEPPAAIQTAILNIADSMAAGGSQIAIRTGDYIAIRQFIREGGEAARTGKGAGG